MNVNGQKMFIEGHEKDSDAERIFLLIDKLKLIDKSLPEASLREPFHFFRNVTNPWHVRFAGDPSLRHANKIAIFREFLSELLATDLRVSGYRYGSVIVEMTPKSVPTEEYVRKSEELFLSNSALVMFNAMAQKLEISEICFGGRVFPTAATE
jgi:hypothetical protein